mmetsp:Transcript_62883/g.138438  ORF Transcript_62883/g.138438 Transcript_62883/m.138438 type:complete len:436 (-) Transcript_62883:70-1377(-)
MRLWLGSVACQTSTAARHLGLLVFLLGVIWRSDAVCVASGLLHTCACVDDGVVTCWGRNNYGQLGQGNSVDLKDARVYAKADPAKAPVDLGTGRTAMELSAGKFNSCARLDNGEVKCWGYNVFGSLGLGDLNHRGDDPGEMGAALASVALGVGRTAVELASGYWHTCARLDNGAVKCWGGNGFGQLGIGDVLHRGDSAGEMGDALDNLDFGAGRTAIQLAAGTLHTCARLNNDDVKCWGHNDWGQLGQGDINYRGDQPSEMGDDLPPVDLGIARTALQIVAGKWHTCARLDYGGVKCWGKNLYGVLGQGDTAIRGDEEFELGEYLDPIDLGRADGQNKFTLQLAAGNWHTCAILDDHTVKCWGYNSDGQLGYTDLKNRGDLPGQMGNNLPIVDLGQGRTAVEISAGRSHTCARLDNGAVKCWGYIPYGDLGLTDV